MCDLYIILIILVYFFINNILNFYLYIYISAQYKEYFFKINFTNIEIFYFILILSSTINRNFLTIKLLYY